MEKSTWLSLSDAADLLGVHFTTLRRWTDLGLVDHVRTPGGMRKYTRKAIDDFIERHHHQVPNQRALEEIKNQVVIDTRAGLSSQKITDQGWYLQLNEDHRMQMRNSGNHLIALLVQYCTRDSNNEILLQEGGRIAQEYGQFCYCAGMTLAECTRIFLFFRRSMLNTIHTAGTQRALRDVDSHHLFERMGFFLDEFLVGMVEGFNQP